MEYELKEIDRRQMGVIKYIYYEVLNYNNNEESLKEYVKQLNEKSMFNVEYFIYKLEDNKAIIEVLIDTLD